MTVRRVVTSLLAALWAVGLFAAPAQADPGAEPPVPQEGGQWLNCHPHSFQDWCQVLGPGWHMQFWQYCDSVWGKQEYCVQTPAPAEPALAPRT